MINTVPIRSGAELEELHGVLVEKRQGERPRISVCTGTGCIACGATRVV